MKIKIPNVFVSLILFASTVTPGLSAEPFTTSFPGNLQVLATNTGPGPGAPSGPGPYHVANMSSGAQRRWMRVTVPKPFADQLPTVCTFTPQGAPSTLAYKGRVIGPIGTEFHVLGDLPGFGTQNGQIVAGGNAPSPFQFSEWITDDPTTMAMRLEFVRNSVRQSIPLTFRETLENSPVVRTDRFFGGPVNGVWVEVFLTFYTKQDVVEMAGHYGWSDQSDPSWFTNFESIEFKIEEDVEVYFGTRSGFQQIADGWQLLNSGHRDNGKFPHGMAPHFYGVILPKSDNSSTANPPDREQRLNRMLAAVEGPLLMTGGAQVWSGNWFAFGEVPTVPANLDGVSLANQSASAFRSYLQNVGDAWDTRPLANTWNTGGTGDQAPFGATKGTFAVTVGDPRFLWEMLYSSTDYGLRHFHYREPDGSRVRAANHPNLIWYNGAHDWRFSSDLLGKSGGTWPPWAWNFGDNGRGGPDRQHRGQNYMWATAALTGSYLIQEEARDLIECEATRFPNQHMNTDAPRGGRIFQDFVKMYYVLPSAQEQATLLQQIEWYILAWELGWTGGQVTGPVKPMASTGPDDRVLCCGLQFFVSWNESLGILGWLEARALMRNLGRSDLQNRLEVFIRRVVTTHMNFSVYRDSNNRLLPINGIRWLANGEPNPASYYDINRPGASTSPGPTIDMLLGTPGWVNWWSGLMKGALLLFPTTSMEYQTAAEMNNTWPADSINGAEWRAAGQ